MIGMNTTPAMPQANPIISAETVPDCEGANCCAITTFTGIVNSRMKPPATKNATDGQPLLRKKSAKNGAVARLLPSKACRKAMFVHMYKPPEFLNTRMYNVRFIDQQKEDDAYLWYSQFRRIRRMSTAQRTDSIDGSDLIYDDDNMWDGQLLRNTYTLKGKKDLLTCRHQDMKKTKRETGQGMVNNLSFERCNLYVVEVINKDPNYLYSKRLWYLDPETYYIMWQEIYDQQGKFWKCFLCQTSLVQTATGEQRAFPVGFQYYDLQRTHCGLADHQRYYEPKISIPVDADMFTIGYLQKTY